MFDLLPILAQAAPSPVGAPAPGPAMPPGAGGSTFLFALMIAMVAFMLLTARSQKKRERTERENLYAKLARNERVLTVGGVIGTIVSVKDNEVVLKVDEATNTKMTFVKTAIQRVITDEPTTT